MSGKTMGGTRRHAENRRGTALLLLGTLAAFVACDDQTPHAERDMRGGQADAEQPDGPVIDAGCTTCDAASPVDEGCTDCTDAQHPTDASLRLDKGPVPDEGHSPGDATPVDANPVDAAPPDLYPFAPDPICADPTPIAVDLPGPFELAPSVPGVIAGVIDSDGDGRVEAYVLTRSTFDEVPFEELPRSTFGTIYIAGDEGRLVARGQIVGFSPFAVIDLGGWGRALVGPDAFVDLDARSYAVTLGVRADLPEAPYRYDESVQMFVHEDRRGELQADYFAPFDADVLDADADGQPEILTFSGDLLEWRGDHFEVVWRVVDADPRDDERAVGGGAYGRVTHGDFDGDGRMEFVVDGYGAQGPIGVGEVQSTLRHARIFENTGDDAYRLVARLPFGANNAQFASAGDLNGDGRTDFLYGGSPGGCVRFEVWSADDGGFTRLARIDHVASKGIPPNGGVTAFADLDGDGDDELVINVADALVAWDWRDGGLRQILGHPLCQACNWSRLWTGDLDGDGIDEIMFSERTHEEARAGVVLSPTGFRILRRTDER